MTLRLLSVGSKVLTKNGNIVQKRVTEIKRLLPVDCWRHSPTESNPADIPSRGMSSQLASSDLWHSGPKWINHYKEESIKASGAGCIPEACLKEMTVENREELKTVTFITSTKTHSISNLIDLAHFSNLQRLLRVTAYALQFAKKLKEQRVNGGQQVFESVISAKGLNQAEQCWILDVQGSLRLNKKVEAWSQELNLFTDCDGHLRCRGRMSYAELSYATKHPILLDSNPRFTTLIIND